MKSKAKQNFCKLISSVLWRWNKCNNTSERKWKFMQIHTFNIHSNFYICSNFNSSLSSVEAQKWVFLKTACLWLMWAIESRQAVCFSLPELVYSVYCLSWILWPVSVFRTDTFVHFVSIDCVWIRTELKLSFDLPKLGLNLNIHWGKNTTYSFQSIREFSKEKSLYKFR